MYSLKTRSSFFDMPYRGPNRGSWGLRALKLISWPLGKCGGNFSMSLASKRSRNSCYISRMGVFHSAFVFRRSQGSLISNKVMAHGWILFCLVRQCKEAVPKMLILISMREGHLIEIFRATTGDMISGVREG